MIHPYVEPKRGIHLQEAGVYHRLDLPGFEKKTWVWDLRGDEGHYLGNYDFSGKRVLEFGAATGGLTFWMEKQGAEVVAADLSPDIGKTSWDLLITPEEDLSEINTTMSGSIRRLNNGFWYAHEQIGSQAKLVHGTAYSVPPEIGRFDVVTVCAILLHLRDPMGALENMISFTDKAIIIADLVPYFLSEPLQKLPLAYFIPTKNTPRTRHGGWTWWHVSPEVYVRYLELKGFKIMSNTTGSYRHAKGPREVFTIVAERS
jgi:SAM-dependent methyltransferase